MINNFLGMFNESEGKQPHHFPNSSFLLKVIFRDEIGSNIKKYKFDTIQLTNFVLEDPMIVFGQNCLIAN